jgi:hypothetical protein
VIYVFRFPFLARGGVFIHLFERVKNIVSRVGAVKYG